MIGFRLTESIYTNDCLEIVMPADLQMPLCRILGTFTEKGIPAVSDALSHETTFW